MTGMSNGGMMAYRYVAQNSREIAALAVVAGCIGSEKQKEEKKWVPPRPEVPVPLFIVHGEDDFVVPFEGGFGRREGPRRTFRSVGDACEFWREANGCSRFSRQRFFLDNRIIQMWWEGNRPDQAVMLYRIRRWGHVWPGRSNTESLNENDTLKGFDIAPIIWNFFKDRKRSD
jgi:polyhydroxybutyrate depolymerase